MPNPLRRLFIEVVIPVHKAERPVERAVASVLDDYGHIGVIVVCHNISAEVFEQRLRPFGSRVRIIEHHDGIPSPAGPLNAGLDAAHALWVTCMGSDDFEESGAPAAWSRHLQKRPVDALILPAVAQVGGVTDIPPTRPRHLRNLHPVKDRLSYRTGPLFLVKKSLLDAHGIRMTPTLRTGEDLAYSSHVWMSARTIDLLKPGSPRYVEGNDGGERVTSRRFPLPELLAPAGLLSRDTWVFNLDSCRRHALAVRVVRRTIVPAVATWAQDADEASDQKTTLTIHDINTALPGRETQHKPAPVVMKQSDADVAAQILRQWMRIDPRLHFSLSKVEHDLVTAIVDCAPLDKIRSCAHALTAASSLRKVLPYSLQGIFDRDTRIRHFVSSLSRPRKWR